MKSKDLREYAKKKGVFLWQIANELGICEQTVTRRLRKELSREEKSEWKAAIDKISECNKNS